MQTVLSDCRKLKLSLLPSTLARAHTCTVSHHYCSNTAMHRRSQSSETEEAEKEEMSGLYESVSRNEMIMASPMLTS